jgi:hypothetical protein
MTGIQASKILRELTKNDLRLLRSLIQDSAKNYNYSAKRESEIIALLNKILQDQARILSQLILQAHRDSYLAVFDQLRMPVIPIQRSVVETLARDTIRDYTRAIESSENYIRNIFKLSKQDILRENKISETVLDQLMNQGDFRTSAKELNLRFLEKGSTDLTKIRRLNPSEIRERISRARRALAEGKGIPKYIQADTLQAAQVRLAEGKFITIINKNGDPMTFSLEYYSELVARTRVADAQTQGTIDAGNELGVELYYVTDHNTDTAICEQFEGRYLSPDDRLVGKIFEGKPILKLNAESKPIYHPNCKHRLLAYPLTDFEIEQILGGRNAA